MKPIYEFESPKKLNFIFVKKIDPRIEKWPETGLKAFERVGNSEGAVPAVLAQKLIRRLPIHWNIC